MDLNEKQKLVVNELDRNILLLASAGTGKTDTLSKRIANIINSKKAKPEEILCITFTNKGAREMENRIREIIGKDASKLTVKTFHSFCYDIVKMESKKGTDIFTDFIIFDENDCEELIKSFIQKTFSINSVQRFINLLKEESIKNQLPYDKTLDLIFATLEGDIDYICTENKKVNYDLKGYFKLQGVNLVNLYNSMLWGNHGLDFNDLIIKAKEVLSNENTLKYLRGKYKYINVDEVQDTSTVEYSIIESVFYNNNILVCGDIFQTIYSWRGSNPSEILMDFSNKYSPIEITFNKNYRATKTLTSASLEYLLSAFSDAASEVYSEGILSEAREVGEKISIKESENIYDEARFIYSEINNLLSRGEDISKTCVLTRDNLYNINLSKELSYIQKDGQGFQFVLVDQYKFFRRMEVKDVLAFLKLIANKHDSVSFKRILKRFSFGVGEKTINEIESDVYKGLGIVLSDFLENITPSKEYFSMLIEELNNDNIVVFDVESTGIDVTEDEIIQIAAIKINSKGETIETFEKFICPVKSVRDSVHVHGFSDEYLSKVGEDKVKVLNQFLEFSNGAVIVGHNVQFDINILSSELLRCKLSDARFKGFYDTLDIYRRFHSNLENHKLETLSRIFETKHAPSHNAMDDILATGELLVKSVNDDIIPTSFERIKYMGNHIRAFLSVKESLKEIFDFSKDKRPHDIVAFLVKKFNLSSVYKGGDGENKIERLRDFYVLLKDLDDSSKQGKDAILDVLKITSLSNGDLENIIIKRSNKIRIPIITVHQAKGLEYENVFIAGLQEGKFPSYRAIKSNDLNEEKRTFYVAITRAKKRLYLSYNIDAGFGRRATKSRFIDFLPQSLINYK